MVTVVRGTPNIGASLGTGLSQGLVTRLNQMAEHKAQEIHQRNALARNENILRGIPDVTPEEIEAYKHAVDPQVFKEITHRLMLRPGEREFARLLGNQDQPGTSESSGGTSELAGAGVSNQQQAAGGQAAPRPGVALTERQAVELANKRHRENTTNQKERHFHLNQQKKSFEAIREGSEAARQNIKDNEELIGLARTGDLRGPNANVILERLGLEDLWRNPTTQLAAKNIARQAQNAATDFKTGRLTNLDVNLYRKSLASLNNSADVIEVIAKNKILAERLKIARQEAIDQLIEQGEYKGIISKADKAIEPLGKELAGEALRNVQEAIKKEAGQAVGNHFSVGQKIGRDAVTNLPLGTELSKGGKLYVVTSEGIKAKE